MLVQVLCWGGDGASAFLQLDGRNARGNAVWGAAADGAVGRSF